MSGSGIFEVVLLVEDDLGHAHLIKRALKSFAREVRHVVDLQGAAQEIQQQRLDLVVMDLHLPDSSGVADVEHIKARCGDTPLVVLTSSTSLRDAVEAMKSGASDFIVKNFDVDFKEVLGFALSRLYAAQRLMEERLRFKKEMELLRLAIENSHDGLAVANELGDVRYANSSFKEFARRCGKSPGHIVNMFGSAVNRFEDLRRDVQNNLRELPEGASWRTEITFIGDTNSAFDMSLSIVDAPDKNGPEMGRECVVWVRDVSEMKRREVFQREILSTTTHDLKGPLGSISLSSEMLAEMLEKGAMPYEIALRIGSSAQGAIQLIDEFLSARRIQEGTFILKPAVYEAGELIEEVLETSKALSIPKRIEVKQQIEPGCKICVDKMGFARVLGNLVSNAIKFTPRSGSVWVRARMAGEDLQLEVEDSGSGMEASEVQKIFQRFTRLERHGEIAGSGIGLFIVKSIVAAHGGKIEVTSQVDKGTTFRITFPHNPPVDDHGELISLDFA
ncbi:MAG: response regulator [Deltaproteobacteria bacterium]|nr:response regulator [Deltaproteobacteria bacterium]